MIFHLVSSKWETFPTLGLYNFYTFYMFTVSKRFQLIFNIDLCAKYFDKYSMQHTQMDTFHTIVLPSYIMIITNTKL
jgi:hypothetical protein